MQGGEPAWRRGGRLSQPSGLRDPRYGLVGGTRRGGGDGGRTSPARLLVTLPPPEGSGGSSEGPADRVGAVGRCSPARAAPGLVRTRSRTHRSAAVGAAGPAQRARPGASTHRGRPTPPPRPLPPLDPAAAGGRFADRPAPRGVARALAS